MRVGSCCCASSPARPGRADLAPVLGLLLQARSWQPRHVDLLPGPGRLGHRPRPPLTGSLVLVATFFTIVITVPLASFAAMRQDRAGDHAVRLFSLMGLGMPSFWFGIILIVLFSVDLHWFPVGGYGTSFWAHLHSLLLPGLCAAIGIVPVLIRSLRVGMLEVLGADYVATARAKGLRRPCHLRARRPQRAHPDGHLARDQHRLPDRGTVVIERVFALNGLGSAMLTAIDNRDFPVVQASHSSTRSA